MLIGLTGVAGAGKDTVYETVAELYSREQPVERRSFADPLYASAAAALGVTVEDLRAWKRDPDVGVAVVSRCNGVSLANFQSVRSYLQRYGTEAHREVFGTDFWIAAANLRNHLCRIVLVTDVRFENEAQAVINARGHMVRVEGPQEAGAEGHASEVPLPDRFIDYVVNNEIRDDHRANLRRQVLNLISRVRRAHGQMP